LVGCWISVKVSPNLRPAIYECIILLLQPTEDIIVRLEAAQTLKLDILCLRQAVVEAYRGILSCYSVFVCMFVQFGSSPHLLKIINIPTV